MAAHKAAACRGSLTASTRSLFLPVYLHCLPELCLWLRVDPVTVTATLETHIAVSAAILGAPGLVILASDALLHAMLRLSGRKVLEGQPRWLDVAYGWLPMVWASTLAFYTYDLMSEAGKVLPVSKEIACWLAAFGHICCGQNNAFALNHLCISTQQCRMASFQPIAICMWQTGAPPLPVLSSGAEEYVQTSEFIHSRYFPGWLIAIDFPAVSGCCRNFRHGVAVASPGGGTEPGNCFCPGPAPDHWNSHLGDHDLALGQEPRHPPVSGTATCSCRLPAIACV